MISEADDHYACDPDECAEAARQRAVRERSWTNCADQTCPCNRFGPVDEHASCIDPTCSCNRQPAAD